ncbi:MAG: hypothetical protein H7X89_15795 [Rhizobiales bacterium]|nr:hypothetical protein [Hyphomicrobiales bacterium]
MMDKIDENRVREFWDNGMSIACGQTLFEYLREEDRPIWASNVLKTMAELAGIQLAEIDEAIDLARTPNRWPEGHLMFDKLRTMLLRLSWEPQSRDDHALTKKLISLAELTAKVSYNATNPPDAFDDDNGWYIPNATFKIVGIIDGEAVADKVVRALASCLF